MVSHIDHRIGARNRPMTDARFIPAALQALGFTVAPQLVQATGYGGAHNQIYKWLRAGKAPLQFKEAVDKLLAARGIAADTPNLPAVQPERATAARRPGHKRATPAAATEVLPPQQRRLKPMMIHIPTEQAPIMRALLAALNISHES